MEQFDLHSSGLFTAQLFPAVQINCRRREAEERAVVMEMSDSIPAHIKMKLIVSPGVVAHCCWSGADPGPGPAPAGPSDRLHPGLLVCPPALQWTHSVFSSESTAERRERNTTPLSHLADVPLLLHPPPPSPPPPLPPPSPPPLPPPLAVNRNYIFF